MVLTVTELDSSKDDSGEIVEVTDVGKRWDRGVSGRLFCVSEEGCETRAEA